MPATLTPQEFVNRWRSVAVNEKKGSQQHFLDLCALVGHQTPLEEDPRGEWFTFEMGAKKLDGANGFADVWKKGHFAVEYKGPHGDLGRAYKQLLDYREALENPPLLVVSDMQTVVIHTNFTNTEHKTHTVTLDAVATPEGVQTLRNLFYHPEAFHPSKIAERVTTAAAAEFARLADHLRRQTPHSAHEIAHYLIRLLFILFAEDIDLLPRDLFTRLVEKGRRDPATFNRQMRQLFQAMAVGDVFGESKIRWFDGGLFNDAALIDLDAAALEIVHAVTRMDWTAMEPSIMGTVFTRSLDPAKRAQLGAQYTSKEDILLIVEPVLMQPFRREWASVQERARALAARRDAAPNRAAWNKAQNELRALVMGFVDSLRALRVLDPACGSGNFLYVALRLLLELEQEVSFFCGEVGLQPFFTQVSPAQFYGIEKDDYAHELAQATVWIGYLQWQHEQAQGVPREPVLELMDNIKQMDAILAYDDAGRPVEPEWPQADVIVGNPPFLGDRRMRGELGDSYTDQLRSLYAGRIPGNADLVTFWFERALTEMQRGAVRRVGLLATNSIRGGANRTVLERVTAKASIFYAWSDRPWILDGAAVRVSMVGFDSGVETNRMLDGLPAAKINADLTSSSDLTLAKTLSENARVCFYGTVKIGPLDLDADTARKMLEDASNPNGRPNSDVVKPFANALDIVRRWRNVWIIDFGVDMPVDEAMQYTMPFSYIQENVRPFRAQVRRDTYRNKWWLLGEPCAGMRSALAGLSRYIVTPGVSKHRVFAWLPCNVLPDHALMIVARSDDYFFGVLHSKAHELWSLRMCTWLGVGNDPRYTPTTTFETFPFPWPPGQEAPDDPRVQAIADAARELVELRNRWLDPEGASDAELKKRTLTNLYNARPAWLALAHAALDRAVGAAYGWPEGLADEEILERLLALNLERAAA